MKMNAESQWIIVMTLVGALFATLLHTLNLYLEGDINFATVVICVAFFVALIMSPTYNEVSEYWREKHGK